MPAPEPAPAEARTLVVVPTFEEAENIEEVLRRLRAANPGVDVLVVDDSSPDGTADLARTVGEEVGRVEVEVRAVKDGLGSAYRHGFRIALDRGYDRVVQMDADLSHDPAALPDLLAAVGDDVGLVIGSRYVPGGKIPHWPWHRRALSKWGNRYTTYVLRLPVRDCTSGFRAYRADALRSIDPASTTADGYAFLTELVRKLIANGSTIVETPIVFRDRRFGTSKMSGRIIAESMLLVTKWAIFDRKHIK